MKNIITNSRAPATLDGRAKAMTEALAKQPKFDMVDAGCRAAALATLWMEAEEAAFHAQLPASLPEVGLVQAEEAAKYGGRVFDDLNEAHEWVSEIDSALPADPHMMTPTEIRMLLIKIAALALSGADSIARNTGAELPDEIDAA